MMGSEQKVARAQHQQLGAPLPSPAEQDPLPCPRCHSTNTKFCYYNNYNFSQPRHFCKSCRRYWTHGGTLRDIPVGGGTRKSAKRCRTSSGPTISTISTESQPIPATPLFMSLSGSGSGLGLAPASSFTSLLSGGGPLGGFGFGLGIEEVGFGLGRGVWGTSDHHHHHHHQVGGYGDTWQVENGGDHHHHQGDCFSSLPELAISTTVNGLK